MAPPTARLLKFVLARMGIFALAISTMVCILAVTLFLLNPSQPFALPTVSFGSLQEFLPSYLQTHHQGWWPAEQPPNAVDSLKKDNWNLLYHLGGNGPWIEKVDGVAEGGIAVPDSCKVDMVHMMSRHAERYPTQSAGARMMDVLARIKATGQKLSGAMEFVNTWEFITTNPAQHFEQLTTTGPYAGVLEAFTTGVKLATRYGHLWNASEGITHLWASDCGRVIDTARHFSAGFFGLESPDAKVIIVSEDEDKAGDTLTPGDTCKNYLEDEEAGHDNGYTMLRRYRSTYLPAIASRLSLENPGFNFTDAEIYSMQETCGFETLVRGYSPWCALFTHEEWSSFEYARDILHFFRAGPGNKYARAMGWLWLNATTNLLAEGPESAGPLYFSFVHDGDMIPMLAALGLFEDKYDLPVTHIDKERKWKTSQVTPMGGRIIFERLTCSGKEGRQKNRFVRFNVNDGIVPLDGCSSGPGSSCGLEEFGEYVKRRGEEAGDFRSVCGLPSDVAGGLTFLRQPGRV